MGERRYCSGDLAQRVILDALLWLPVQVILYFFKPVTATFETFEEMTNQAIDDYIKENPLDQLT